MHQYTPRTCKSWQKEHKLKTKQSESIQMIKFSLLFSDQRSFSVVSFFIQLNIK